MPLRLTRFSVRLFSLPNRVLLLFIGPAMLALLGLLALLYTVSMLSDQTKESEQARLAMEDAQSSALQVERARALLHELFAASVRGDLQELFRIRSDFDAQLSRLGSSTNLLEGLVSRDALAQQPDQVLDAAEALVQRDAPAASAIMNAVDAQMSAVAVSLDAFADAQAAIEEQARASALNALQIVVLICMLLLGLSVTGVLLLLFGLERLVRRPLSGILEAIERIRSGKITEPIPQQVRGDPVIERIHVALDALAEHELERQETMLQLEHLAQFDALTGLPNRVLLADRLSQAMARSRRLDQFVGVVFIDLDEFKVVNDLHGHAFGDQMLVALADRMRSMLREEDTLARLGGDEFVAVLPDLSSLDALRGTLERLLQAASEPIDIKGTLTRVTASAGITMYPQSADIDADQLLRQADQAMYKAKQEGKNNFALFDPEQEREVRQQHELLARLQHALNHGELLLYYQPKIDLLTGAVIGAEALIRWQDPERGLIGPADFLPAVEHHRLAISIGQWGLDQALRDFSEWRARGWCIPVAVNVFPLHLQQPDFSEQVSAILADHEHVEARQLELEIVESAALSDIKQASEVIRKCGELGLKIALDDFGTGYSSLTYLRRLPVTDLKLDQSFVRGMLDNRDDLVIIQAVLDLARSFGLQVIAEGVETIEHGEQLIKMGCRFAQGYAIARPMPVSELGPWVDAWSLPPQWKALAGNLG